MFGNLLNFEAFNLKNIGRKIAKNPEQLLLGAADPFSAGVWSKVTGKEYSPLVDQWGGATSDTYRDAEAAGIDTTAGKGMHNIARTVASFYAGGYGADKAGLLGGAQPAGQGLQMGGSGYGGLQAGTGTTGISGSGSTIGQGIGNGIGGTSAGTGWGGYLDQGMKGLQAASQAQGLLGAGQQPVQAQPLQQRPGPDMSGLLAGQQQIDAQRMAEDEKRRLAQQYAVQGLLGGRNGLA